MKIFSMNKKSIKQQVESKPQTEPSTESIKNTKKKPQKSKELKTTKKQIMFFANMKIAPKILIGFLIVAFLSTAMGIYAALSLQEVGASSKKIYANILLPTKSVADFTKTFDESCNALRQSLLLDKDDIVIPAVLSTISSNEQIILSALSMVESMIPPEKADVYLATKQDYDTFNSLLMKAVEEVKNGNKEAVIEDLTDNGELKQAESNLKRAADDLMFAVTGDAAAMSTKNNKTGDQVFLITVIAIGVVLVLSVLSGVIISRSISRPVKKLTQSITRLASGETDIDLDEKATKDEIGRMCEATRTITNAIITLEQDTGMLIDAATEGQLTVRADAQVHRGIYRKIVEGINATMDAMIAPITESTDVLKELAKGNLNAEVSGDFKGDFALIKMALNETIETLKGYIQGITYMLGEMSEGVLTVKIESDYAGDFSVIKSAFNKSIESFNSVLSEINVAAEEVSSGTEQVSGSSQTISAGASEQSSALEQLSSSIAQIAEQTKSNADRAKKANQLSLQVKDNAIGGSEKMETLLGAMEEINDASASIFKIIKVIDDIAFQTNILALNAAIEAARAGVHGKGFAVVAEEVRNLAAKSAQAAKETTDLIDGSIRKTKVGTEIANVTAGALKEMVQSINTTVSLSEEIASSSGEQAVGINQINKGIMQLSDVVQSNSATAQEMAASSEELSGQAAMLKDMVGRFSLDEDNRNNLLEKPADIKLIDM